MKKGEKMSVELKLKLSLAKKGKVFTDEHKANLSKAHKGKIPSNLEMLRTYRKGRPLTEEHKKRIGDGQKGKVMSPEARIKIGLAGKGRVPWNKEKGNVTYVCKTCNEEFSSKTKDRIYCSLKCSTQAHSGENNYRYIEDRSKLKLQTERGGPRHKAWSKDVKKRDNWKCFFKKNCSGKMEAHHILSWKSHPEERFNLSNGVTLCHKHHMEVEHKGLEILS